jgi:hypothetical protein
VILLLSYNTAAVAVVMALSTIWQRNTVEKRLEHVSRLYIHAGFDYAIHMGGTCLFVPKIDQNAIVHHCTSMTSVLMVITFRILG